MAFSQLLSDELALHKLKIKPHWHIDHICYRTVDLESYDKLKFLLSKFSDLLAETEVSGRDICTFKLHQSFYFENRKIDLIELPAPKVGSKYQTGFEHIEIVIAEDFEDIKSILPLARFKESGLAKDFNAELALKLDTITVKFHQLSLESVVNLENNRSIFNNLKKLNILKDFKKHKALVAGTFPLGLNVADSDIDILLTSEDLKYTLSELKSKYGSYDEFKYEYVEAQSLDSLVVNFKFEGIEYEVFVQETSSVQQWAYKHFLIEERLLKYGGSPFKEKVLKLRQQGFKTEAAFCEALNIKYTNPFDSLLELFYFSEETLNAYLK